MQLMTPIGPLVITASDRGLQAIQFEGSAADRDKGRRKGVLDEKAAQQVESAAVQLCEYFEGRRSSFSLSLDPAPASAWSKAVIERLSEVPFGETTTYGALAAGVRGAGVVGGSARAVGRVMSSNVLPIIWPCHRVVGSDGSLTGYAGGLNAKRWLLEMERDQSRHIPVMSD